jgi:N-acyl-phosphatidylethanolamine-hydrolysing phospholipase D
MQPPEDRTVQSQMPTHQSTHGKFRNPWPHTSPHGLRDVLKWVRDRRRTRRPDPPASIFPRATPAFPARATSADVIVTWIGHSSFLLQMGSMNILLDPIWSKRASPVQFAGPKRATAPGVGFDSLPPIDLVLLSHDHYDHLDIATVRRLITRHPHCKFVAPLGVGAWLRTRGATVAAELDWWQSMHSHELDITCTPAQHFSGRRPDNRDSTLWCGWTIRAGDRAVFFAGDTGRHPEFSEITRRLGPFDAVFLPIGAYDPRWFMQPVHMAPDEAVSAYVDVAAANSGRPCRFIAMHWGTFKLTDEPMDEPPALTRVEWEKARLDPEMLWVMAHGETRMV